MEYFNYYILLYNIKCIMAMAKKSKIYLLFPNLHFVFLVSIVAILSFGSILNEFSVFYYERE